MPVKKKKFYISTSIAYASGIPHIGNVYEMILSDSIARFKKMDHYDVYFQTGTDEHGQKIEKKASQEKINTQEYVDHISFEIKRIYDSVGVNYDHFVRTTNDYHKKTVQAIVNKLLKKGDIYLGTYEGWYSVVEESYIAEKDLIDGKTASGETPVWSKEEVYFFQLSKYQERLLTYLNDNPHLILPKERRKEILNLLKEDLTDLSISRTSFKWGIPLSFDPNHVVYVWVDALSNYITGLGFQLSEDGQILPNEQFLKYWPCDLHVIGKDISRFHLIYWPILLMALEIPLPKKFLIHPWILFNNDKISKSTNNVVYIDDLLKFFSVDAIRYFVLHEIPYVSDGTLSYELLLERYNADLVNTIGNLLSRTLGMIKSYRNAQLTKTATEKKDDFNLPQKAIDTVKLVKKAMDSYRVAEAMEHIIQLARYSNKYVDIVEPWKIVKEKNNSAKLDVFLYNLVETLRFIGVLLKPFLPETSESILKQIKAEEETFESLEEFGITQTKELQPGEKLFERLDKIDL
ncbi:MAG: methionine--tRNA ligase [Candidatus Phytoplasma pruni]|nr:methionine--tRNA ligase [Candidatus Phytoplasma pruni]